MQFLHTQQQWDFYYFSGNCTCVARHLWDADASLVLQHSNFAMVHAKRRTQLDLDPGQILRGHKGIRLNISVFGNGLRLASKSETHPWKQLQSAESLCS